MKRWRTRLLLLAGGASLLAAIPAFSQQQSPESLLPPGFGGPLPPPEPANQTQPATPASTTPAPIVQEAPALVETGQEGLTEEALPEPPKPIEIPDFARRSTEMVGPEGPENWGLAPDAFGVANGRFLSTLMRRLDAPLPSRWASILLRRTLLSRTPAPSYVSPVDWVAERAWLLLRMGEADGARMLVQAVDVDQFTPKMFNVAVQTALAIADPAALCPLVEPGRALSDEPVWPLADAMCAALSGDSTRASALIDDARKHSGASGIDLSLAEKVVGAGLNTRRAVTIEWDNVDRLNAWRFGLASATGLQIPDRLMDEAGPRVKAWLARAPMLPLDERLEATQTAASLGVFSNASLVQIYSLLADDTDPSEISESVGGRLREAYVGRTVDDRMTAIHSLWNEATTPVQRHARRILTAVAAARIPPSEALAPDAPDLIASMLTAGMDRSAARWAPVVSSLKGAASDRAWALLAVATPQPSVDLDPGRIADFSGRDESLGKQRSKLLFAALAGLGRIDQRARENLAQRIGVDLGRRNRWTAMIDQAAKSRQSGTVALLTAVGMQTGGWQGVPPEHFYHMIKALHDVGLDYEARMIAAEALSRL